MPANLFQSLRKLKKPDRQNNSAQSPDSLQKQGYTTYRSSADPLYCPWTTDAEFHTVLDRIMGDVRQSPDCGIIPDGFEDGRYIQWSLAKQAAHLEGDFMELGVHHGIGSHLFGSVLDRYGPDKILWSIDSFEGLSEPEAQDIDPRNGAHFWRKHSLDNVHLPHIQTILGQHACKINIVQGWIPEVFRNIPVGKLAFLHVDVDIYRPTLDSLSFAYDKVVPGGILLFDDYGFPMCPGARAAIDDFFRTRKEVVIPLPTGQAMVCKLPE